VEKQVKIAGEMSSASFSWGYQVTLAVALTVATIQYDSRVVSRLSSGTACSRGIRNVTVETIWYNCSFLVTYTCLSPFLHTIQLRLIPRLRFGNHAVGLRSQWM
jgi:hypothetical protein